MTETEMIVSWLKMEAEKLDATGVHWREILDKPPVPPLPSHLTPQPDAPERAQDAARIYRRIAWRIESGDFRDSDIPKRAAGGGK